MAYNSSKGPQTHGDVKYEGDAEDTQIDFENDFVAIKTNGVQRLIVNSNTVTSSVAFSCSHGITGSSLDVGNFTTIIDTTHISSSLPVSASSFWANGVQITGGGGGAVANYNTSGDNRIITSVDSDTIQGEQLLTFDGETLTVTGDLTASVGMVSAHVGSTGHITASLGITGSAIHAGNFTTVIDTTHVSSSLNVSASGFYGDGSGLTGLPSAAISTYNTSGDNRIITSVNSTTVQGESALTFDGETLSVTGDLTASVGISTAHLASTGHITASLGITGSAIHAGNSTTVIDTTHVSSSLPVSASSFWANGVQITGGGTPGGANTQIQFNNAGSFGGSSNLVWSGTKLTVGGADGEINVTGSLKVGVNLDTGHKLHVSGSPSDVLCIMGSDTHETIFAVTGSGKVAVGGAHLDAKFNITGSNEDKFLSIKSTDVNPVVEIDNNHISASINLSASAFYGSGQHLTNLPSAAITTYNTSGDNRIITSVNSTTVQGESALTFDGETLSVTGDLTASVGMASAHVASTGHITASLGITGSAIHAGNHSTVIDTTHVSSSLAVSASSFWANGVQLTAGGGGSPGGSDTQIQYNNGGSFGGEANFVYDDGNDRVGIGNSAPTHTLSVTGGVAFTGDLTVTGTIRATKIIDVTRHYFSYGGTGATFIPHGEGSSDDATTAVTKTQFVAAFSGRLKRVIVRPKNAQNGHITASLHVAGDGVEDFAAGGSIVQHITQSMGGAATHGNINFSGSTTQFTAGQIVGVAIDFKNNPGDTNVTCIWEYNTTEDVLS